jgi:hypothetical protein
MLLVYALTLNNVGVRREREEIIKHFLLSQKTHVSVWYPF